MDIQEYRQFVAILQDALDTVYVAQRDLDHKNEAAETFRQLQVRLEKAIKAYREKINAYG
jgi:hypothetical protein